MFTKCIEPFVAASPTSSIAGFVLVETDFPGHLGGKSKLKFWFGSWENVYEM